MVLHLSRWQMAVYCKNSGFRRLRYIFSSFGYATFLLRQTTGTSQFLGCITVSQVTTQEITTSVTKPSPEPVTNSQITLNTIFFKIEHNWCTGTNQAELVDDKTEVQASQTTSSTSCSIFLKLLKRFISKHLHPLILCLLYRGIASSFIFAFIKVQAQEKTSLMPKQAVQLSKLWFICPYLRYHFVSLLIIICIF